MINLLTDRLVIRDYLINDLDNHHKLLSDEKVMYYLQDIRTNTIEESKENLLRVIFDQKSSDRKFYHFAVESRDNGEFIGGIGYTVLSNTPFGKLVNVGYFIFEKFWNRGFTTEALKRVIEFAFNESNVYRIHTGCLKENKYSEMVMKKCGFIKEAEFFEYVFHDGKFKDRVEYRLLKKEWQKLSY